ncbi:N-acetylgalactosamine 6-sulfate sulfatase [Maribacter algicola]|uniref:N-acetylgalactosamine 6-sulfate sulfatase n=1 Tax=Maribacter algicola TaxID=2498892 RepID=A0A3R8R198_9FLAO|nr:arylsulfatase [Maribacter algicola]RRQ48038.1 N-acetylgalactosamine 6-sulfate sulfatase [Maribacter algicola]
MCRILKIGTSVILLLLLLTNCKEVTQDASEKKVQRPNVILIMADDQGWGDLSFHGNTNLNTPNIDAIARNGVSFTNFFVQPVCSPTRAELLTGKYFTRLGVHDTSAGGERMDIGVPTIADILKNYGYKTAAFGKWHNGMQPPYHPNARGFDEFYGFASGHWGNYFSPMLEHNGAVVRGNGFLADDLTDHAISFIQTHKNEPFFVYLPLNTPHSPMQVPDAYWNRFKDKELNMAYQNPEEEDTQFTWAALAMVENIDVNVGRISEHLKTLGLEGNTIVIYLSDNGPNGWRWNGGLRGKKGATDEGGVKTPFYIRWKDHIKPGIRVDRIGGSVDITPTLLGLLDLSENEFKADGVNLAPWIFEPNSAYKDRIIYNHWAGRTSLRSQKYRLDDENRLYDMVNDPGQKLDIAEKLPKIQDSLLQEKLKWLSKYPPLTKETDDRPFTLGHPNFKFTQLPARDAMATGEIERSNRFPNNTFFTNWTQIKDSIYWDIETLKKGKYQVTLYYTLPEGNEGTEILLQQGKKTLKTTISEVYDPPLKGMENDRVARMESYVKDFKPLNLGVLELDAGRMPLVLKLDRIKSTGPDVRLLHFERIE